jgi:hypothetical protein
MSNQKTIEKKKRLGILVIFTLSIMLVMPFLQVPTVKAADIYSFQFDGAINENTWGYLGGTNVTVRAYPYIGVTFDSFQFNSTNSPYVWNLTYVPLYFSYEWNLTTLQHREYWLSSNDNTNWTGTGQNYRCFFSTEDQTTYTINFLDQVGLLSQYPYIKISDGGTYNTVEKRKADVQNSVSVSLVLGKTYDIWLSGSTDYFYGQITPTSTTGIQLVIRGVDFPKETLLIYQYIHASAIRDFLNPLGAITTSYEDITNSTTSVTLTITDTLANTVVYNAVFTNQTFSYSWITAINATTYHVTLNIVTTTYGNLQFSYMLPAEGLHNTGAFSLEFLGTLGVGISTAWIIPALLIIFVAGCFSELTSEAAAIITIIIAIILVWMGWLEISTGAIITALTLSVLAGIVSVKRRFG